jgi:glycosyltransferase involved in cell wall biosynthesis
VAPHAWGRLLLGAVFERASRVLVQTDRIRRDVERVFPRAAPVVLPNGIEIPPPVLPPAAAGPSLLFVGNLLPRKGVHVLLAALRGCPVIPAVIVGGGPERGRLEALASGLKVEFRGEVPPAAVRDLMRREGRLLVLPAVAGEGQPNVLMEAMSVGLPVVASDVAGVRDLLEDGAAGVVVPPGDPARLAQAVASLWQDEARRAALAAAARVAIEKYAWDRVLPQYEEILAAAARRQLKAG